METVKIVFDIDSKDVKTTTDELKALNKVTTDEINTLDKLSNTAKSAGDGFVSLRTRVKEAKEEAVKAAEKYGEFSKEANNAKLKAGALADQMGDLNRQVNLLNPEAKAKAFSTLAQGVVGAFSVATGALQAFGVKNKEVEALAMKLQGALNITQGIASLKGLKESYEDIKVVLGFTTVAQESLTVATEAGAVASTEAAVATKGFTASLLSNPVFLVVAAIAALAAAMILLGDDTEEAKQEVVKMTDAQKDLRAASNSAADAADKLAVAQGKLTGSAASIKKAYRDNAAAVEDLNEKIRVNNAEINKNNKIITEGNETYKKYRIRQAGLRADLRENKEIVSVVNKEYFVAADANKALEKTNIDLSATIKAKNKETKASIELVKEEEKAKNADQDKADAKQAQSDAKQAASESKQQAAERLDQAKKEYDDAIRLRNLKQQNAVEDLATEEEKLALQQQFALSNYEADKKNLESSGATADQLAILWQEYYKTREGLTNKQADLEKKKQDAEIKSTEDFFKKLQGIIDGQKKKDDPLKAIQDETDALDAAYAEQYALAKKNGDDTSVLDQKYLEATAALEGKFTAERLKQEAEAAKGSIDIEKNKQAEKKAIIDGAFQLAAFAGATLFEGVQRQNDEELAALNDQKDKKIINEKQYQARLKEIKNKQAQDAKKQAIYQASLDFSAALINALTINPAEAIPAAVIFATVLAAANLAKIIATPVPKFAKGTLAVPGLDMGRDSVHAMLQPGEAVIPVQTNRAYHPTIRAIYEKKISPSEINNFVMSRTKSGGASKVTASVDTYALSRALGKNKTVEVGNASVIGKAMARELMRGQNLRRL